MSSLKEVYSSDNESDFWNNLTKKMMQVVWHHDDIVKPFHTHDIYHLFNNKSYRSLKLSLGITNVIDSLVDKLIKTAIDSSIKHLDSCPYISDIELYLSLQSASEIVHQKVYKIQFDLVIDPESRNQVNEECALLLKPIQDAYKSLTNEELLVLCVIIESLLIPVIFNIINDVKDMNLPDDILFKQTINMIWSANRFILRDEMLHISGGCRLIQELMRLNIIKYSTIKNIVNIVKQVVVDFINYSNNYKYFEVLDSMETITYAYIKGISIHYDDYPCLSLIKAMIPSIDGFFRGSVSAYLNPDIRHITDPIIE